MYQLDSLTNWLQYFIVIVAIRRDGAVLILHTSLLNSLLKCKKLAN